MDKVVSQSVISASRPYAIFRTSRLLELGMPTQRIHAKPRVLLFQTQSEFGGAQAISRSVADGLEAAGYDVHQAFLFPKGNGGSRGANVFYAAQERPTGPGLLAALFRLRTHIAKVKPDVVMTFQHYGNVIGAPIAKLAGTKRVIANLNSAIAVCPKWVPVADRFFGWLRVYDQVVSNSASTSEEFSHLGRAIGDRLVRIDHGVDAKYSTLSKTEAREQLGLPTGVKMLGCSGRLHELKNQQAIVAMLPLRPDAHLVLAGDGDERENLQRQAAELGVSHRLHLLGEIDPSRIATFLAALDVFVFPSLAESFGLAVAEAAIVGVPVVCNDLPVLREVLSVDRQYSALFVDAADTSALNAAVSDLFDNPEKARALTVNSRQLNDHHSLDRMIDGYLHLLAGSDAPSTVGEAAERERAGGKIEIAAKN